MCTNATLFFQCPLCIWLYVVEINVDHSGIMHIYTISAVSVSYVCQTDRGVAEDPCLSPQISVFLMLLCLTLEPAISKLPVYIPLETQTASRNNTEKTE